MMEKTFQFVDTSAELDKSTRKLMRSHVMKGKNAGRTVHRRSKFELGEWGTPRGAATFPDEEATKRNLDGLEPVARNLGSVLRTFRFPVELSENSLKMINQCK